MYGHVYVSVFVASVVAEIHYVGGVVCLPLVFLY